MVGTVGTLSWLIGDLHSVEPRPWDAGVGMPRRSQRRVSDISTGACHVGGRGRQVITDTDLLPFEEGRASVA